MPVVILLGLRAGIAVIASALAALGIRRGGHGFLSSFAHAILTAPINLPAAILRALRGAEQGSADDALRQQYQVAYFFQSMAALVDYTASALQTAALSTFNVAWVLTRSVIPALTAAGIKPIRISVARLRAVSEAERRSMEQADAQLWGRTRTLEREIARAEAEVARLPGVIDRKIGALGIPRLWHRVGKLEKLLVGAALGALVLSGLKKESCQWSCSGTGKGFGKWLHKMPRRFLKDLLALGTDFFILRNICHVLPWMEDAFATVAAPLVELLTRAGLALCQDSAGASATLAVPDLSLPANPGLSLNLP